MAQVLTSLNGATTDSTGSVLAFNAPKNVYSMQYAVAVPSGGPVVVFLEASLDGVNYFTANQTSSLGADASGSVSGTAPALFIRARVTGLGGGSRTATAIVAVM